MICNVQEIRKKKMMKNIIKDKAKLASVAARRIADEEENVSVVIS